MLEPAAREDLLWALQQNRSEESRRREAFARLTPRESQVLDLLVEGRAAEEISTKNVVSLATVRSQIRSILQKLGVNSQLVAVALARRAGWGEGPK